MPSSRGRGRGRALSHHDRLALAVEQRNGSTFCLSSSAIAFSRHLSVLTPISARGLCVPVRAHSSRA
eukprot:3983226-Pleurochrysis_carterae.AAC.1